MHFKGLGFSYWDIVKKLSSITRNQAVNFKNIGSYEKDTIEFRCPNGTLNPVIWQNNINLFVHLLEYAKSPDFNYDVIFKRTNKVNNNSMKLLLYSKIDLFQATEFK